MQDGSLLRFLLMAVAGRMNRQLQHASVCAKKNRILRASSVAGAFASPTTIVAGCQPKPGCWDEGCRRESHLKITKGLEGVALDVKK
jgi:hypothetical protein